MRCGARRGARRPSTPRAAGAIRPSAARRPARRARAGPGRPRRDRRSASRPTSPFSSTTLTRCFARSLDPVAASRRHRHHRFDAVHVELRRRPRPSSVCDVDAERLPLVADRVAQRSQAHEAALGRRRANRRRGSPSARAPTPASCARRTARRARPRRPTTRCAAPTARSARAPRRSWRLRPRCMRSTLSIGSALSA